MRVDYLENKTNICRKTFARAILSTKDDSFVAVDTKTGCHSEIVNNRESRDGIPDIPGFDGEIVSRGLDHKAIQGN